MQKIINRILTERKMSIRELANALDVTDQAIYAWLHGTKPRLENRRKIEAFLEGK